MNFTSCTPIPLISLSLCIYPPPLQLHLQKKIRYNLKTCLVVEAVVWQCATQSTLLSILLCLQMFIAMSHWSGLRPLASATLSILDPHQNSSWISCCCPVSWRSCSFGSTGPSPSCAPGFHQWDRCRSGPRQSPGSGS